MGQCASVTLKGEHTVTKRYLYILVASLLVCVASGWAFSQTLRDTAPVQASGTIFIEPFAPCASVSPLPASVVVTLQGAEATLVQMRGGEQVAQQTVYQSGQVPDVLVPAGTITTFQLFSGTEILATEQGDAPDFCLASSDDQDTAALETVQPMPTSLPGMQPPTPTGQEDSIPTPIPAGTDVVGTPPPLPTATAIPVHVPATLPATGGMSDVLIWFAILGSGLCIVGWICLKRVR